MAQHERIRGFGDRVAQERRIKSVRDWRDVLKKDIAKALAVEESTVGRWEKGTIPADDVLTRIAKYFGVTPAWLRYGQEPRAVVVSEEEETLPDTRPKPAKGKQGKHAKHSKANQG